jgi:GNAT superfamily N-acetyltransferase
VIVRAADASELDLVCAMRLAFLADADRREQPPELAAATRTFLQERQAVGELHSWLAFDDDRCIGIVSMLLSHVPPRVTDHTTLEGYIINMFVEAAHRRRGIARQLLDACLAEAEELELRRLFLYATDAGRPLYEKAGFARSDSWMHLLVAGS